MTRDHVAGRRAALIQREGCRLVAYLDSVGIPTNRHRPHRPVGPARCRTWECRSRKPKRRRSSATDLAPFEAAVVKAVTAPLTQNQFDACVSLAFNIGATGFAGSTVVHKLNAGDIDGAADAFLMWVRPPELRLRRDGETDAVSQCLWRAAAQPARHSPPRSLPAPTSFRGPAPSLWTRLWTALFRKAD